MAGSKNSKTSRLSKESPDGGTIPALLCFLAAAAVMASAVWYFFSTGATLYWGDAEAHLDIARRILDSRTPGWGEVGTTWLPLPHVLMLPLVGDDRMWQTGLAGAIPAAICTALAATFLFAAVRRIFGSTLAGSAAAAVYLLNPNTLYLGSIPMTEAVFFASLCAAFFFTVRFAETTGWGALAGAGIAAFAGTLTRYEAWFLLPFLALYLAFKGGSNRWIKAAVFCLIAGMGPVVWFAHNYWYYRDALYFYRGPWSAKALQGNLPYPGKGDWQVAIHYFYAAARHIEGIAGLALFAIGIVLSLAKRAWWPVLLLLLSPIFYLWGIHSQGNPIFVPELQPHGWYNIRYAMAFLPLTALGAGALARFGKIPAAAVVVIALAPLLYPFDSHSISWDEAEHNSRPYREMTRQATEYLRAHAGPNETYFTSYGLTGIYRTLDIHFANTLSGDNSPEFFMATNRPDVFLHDDWAISTSGDIVQTVVDKARLRGPFYELKLRITVKGQPVVEIYRRVYEIPIR